MVNFFCQKVEVDTIINLWYNMVNREHGGVTMAEKQPSESIYHRSRLSVEEQRMYDRVCQGIENRETSIQLSLNSFSMNNGHYACSAIR